jgi:hypothetical protein
MRHQPRGYALRALIRTRVKGGVLVDANYVFLLEEVRKQAREVVLCAHGQDGMASISSDLMLRLARAIFDSDAAAAERRVTYHTVHA